MSVPGGGKPSPTVTGQMRDGYEVVEYPTEVAVGGGETQILETGMNGQNEFRPGPLLAIAILLILSAVAIVDRWIPLYLQI